MPKLNLKPTHKAVKDYYKALEQFDRLGVVHESAVRSAFQYLLAWCGRKFKWTLVPEYSIPLHKNKWIVVDGALIDDFTLVHGHWEAKDIGDDLENEVKSKFQDGYPRDNILFQSPKRAILWQNGTQVRDVDLTDPTLLIDILQAYFAYRPQEIVDWEEAVGQFKDKVPDIGGGLSKLIKEQRNTNRLLEVDPIVKTNLSNFQNPCKGLQHAIFAFSNQIQDIRLSDSVKSDGFGRSARVFLTERLQSKMAETSSGFRLVATPNMYGWWGLEPNPDRLVAHRRMLDPGLKIPYLPLQPCHNSEFSGVNAP